MSRSTNPLGNVRMCVAIDKSGSTYGDTLRAEIQAVQSISSLLSPRNESPIQLLPWCDSAEAPISLPNESQLMLNLHSGGGTNPSVLYNSRSSVQALNACGLWFLLTDGQIEDALVQDFAVTTAQIGMHGTACVIIVFGSTTAGPPGSCDVSVGVAAYAVSPNCLFLFHDVATGRLSVLQAKGCFKFLVETPGSTSVQPVLNKYTTWAELPHISYEDLARVQVPPAIKVAPDEIALQDNVVVRAQDLYSGTADPKLVGDIIRNEDSLKSFVIAEMARGSGKDLQKWLESQANVTPILTRTRPDVGGKAQETVIKLLSSLKNGDGIEILDSIRTTLRQAHQENWRTFVNDVFQDTRRYQSNIYCARRQSRGESVPKRTTSYTACQSIGYDYGESTTATTVPSKAKLSGVIGVWNLLTNSTTKLINTSKPDTTAATLVPAPTPAAIETTPSTREPERRLPAIFLPGFRCDFAKPVSTFTGNCMLCKEDSILVILIKSPPDIQTTNFPRRGSCSPLAFPLAMSSFAETDIVSFFLCCDSCALYLVRNCTSPLTETITGALPLVSVTENKEAWLEAIDIALKGRFQQADLPVLLIAILDRKILENQSLPPRAIQSDGVLYQNALLWAKTELSKIAEVPLTLSSSFVRTQQGAKIQRTGSLYTIISDQTLIDPGDPENVDISMLRYPIPGFMVLIRLMRDQGAPPEKLQTHLFQRMVYYITENYFANLESNGNTATVLSLEDLLKANPVEGGLSVAQNTTHGALTIISMDSLLKHNLIDLHNLSIFRTMDGFKVVERQTGSAMAVYLHALSVHGKSHSSAIECFNSLKIIPSLRNVIMKPLAIGRGLAADLILQLGEAK
jgi:hypothetical protein